MPTIIKAEIKKNQLIPPKPSPIRGKPFQLSGNTEWLIYHHGKAVYLYNMKDKSLNKEYREHAYTVGAAKLSPSGNLIASGDHCGILRIFNLDDLSTRLEIKALGGMINDLAWSKDEKFVAVSGEGREQFANVIKIEGGDAIAYGDLTGPSKTCPTVALHFPYCILGSDDKSLTVFRASPKFKFFKTLRDHDGFVQVARFCPDGSKFATAGADGRVNVYQVSSFEVNTFKLHDAGILAMDWIDNETILTASADKSIKIFQSSSGSIIKTSQVCDDWTFSKQICGVSVGGGEEEDDLSLRSVVILRLDGSFECRKLDILEVVVDERFNGIGHSKNVVDLSTIEGVMRSVSYDGLLKSWKQESGGMFTCEKETNLMTCSQKLSDSGVIFENKMVHFDGKKIEEFPSKVVASQKSILILADGQVTGKVNFNFGFPVELAFIYEDLVAVTTYQQSLKVYKIISSNSILLTQSFDDVKITALAFSPSGGSFAISDDQRRIKIYKRNHHQDQDYYWTKEPGQWCNHSARIDTLLWLTDSVLLSAGVDGHIMAWSLESSKTGPLCLFKAAHSAPINKLNRLDNSSEIFASAAADSCIKIWSMTL